MPISRGRRTAAGPAQSQLENINNLIASSEKKEQELYDNSCIEAEVEVEPAFDQDDLWLVKYDELAQKTSSIPLSHLGCCKEGGDLFSSLCMWVDVNQKYVELGLFPQWYDIARELNIDSMKTEWVKVCVRPEQSFTRAILEIYMSDGGTLGDVIAALRKQKQYRIIQEISEQADEFLDVYTVYHKNSYNPAAGGTDNHLYSIMRTLFDTFNKAGYEDPLSKYQDYSQGFKSYFGSRKELQKTGGREYIKAGGGEYIVNNMHQLSSSHHDSGYTSPREYGGYLPAMPVMEVTPTSVSTYREEVKVNLNANLSPDFTVRILLVFARDGLDDADELATAFDNFTPPDCPNIKVDIFRLNEIDLWNAILQNPEACILKWLDEMDFVMPILTPNFLQDLHEGGESQGPPAPTSPLINKYIYSLLRTQYVSSGCKNLKVRPLLPREHESLIGTSKPLNHEPLFRMWNYSDRDTVEKRITAMVKMWAKNNVGVAG